MSLLSKLRSMIERKEILASFSVSDPGSIYKENGYFNIYRTMYGTMTDQRALTTPALLGGIKIIAEDIGSLSLVTMQRSKNRARREPAYNHPLYTLLHDAPNPDMTAMQFREALTANALLTGSGYARIERSFTDTSGRIIAFWPLQPQDIRVDKDMRGRPVFLFQESRGNWKALDPKDIFRLCGFGLTGRDPLNLLEVARKTIGLAEAQQDYAERFFTQDQTPELVLEHPASTDVPAIKEAWRQNRQGADKWHTPAVLQEGMKANLLQRDLRRAQMVEQRAFQLLEVCRLLRLSPHKLADMGRATWGNVEQLNINHYNETLRPWCERWEQTIKLRCLMEEPTIYVKHNIQGFLRGDFKTQTEGFAKLLEKGVYSINEVRGFLDLNPVEGGDGHFIQLNMQSVVDAAREAVEAGDQDASKFLIDIERATRKSPDVLAHLMESQ